MATLTTDGRARVLNDGNEMPLLGLGVWQVKEGDETYNSVRWALELGYRHIDTAQAYGNEESVGRAVKDSGIDRDEIFLTTKCPAEVKDAGGARRAFERSTAALDLGAVDLYLIHAPWPWDAMGTDHRAGNIEVWKVFEELYDQGRAMLLEAGYRQVSLRMFRRGASAERTSW